MSTLNVQLATTPVDSDIPCINNSGADIPAYTVVIVDATNTISNATAPTVAQIGVALPATGGNPSIGFGVTQEIIKANAASSGRVRVHGTTFVKNDGGVTAGTMVDASTTTAGRVQTHVAGKYSFGLCLSTALTGEECLILLTGAAPNA